MMDYAVKGLRTFLGNFKPEELMCLEDKKERWFPVLGSLHPRIVQSKICNALQSAPPGAERLRRISWIRCRLIPLEYRRTWRLCLMAEICNLEDSTELLKRMASYLKVLNANSTEVPFEWIVRERAIYVCFMIGGCSSLPQSSVYVVMCSTHPFMAIHCVNAQYKKRVFAAILAALSGRIKFSMTALLDNVEEGFDKAIRTWGLASSPGGEPYAPAESGSTAGLHNEPQYAVASETARTQRDVATQRGHILHEHSRQDPSSEQALNEHWSGAHSPDVEGNYFCPAYPFCSSSEPQQDLHSHHEEECRTTIGNAALLQPADETAARKVLEFRPLHICDPCGKSFQGYSPYLDHLEECPGIQVFHCPNCMAPFRSEAGLRMHLQKDTAI